MSTACVPCRSDTAPNLPVPTRPRNREVHTAGRWSEATLVWEDHRRSDGLWWATVRYRRDGEDIVEVRNERELRPRTTTPTVAERATVDIYTDGACIPNPGPGGWGAVLRFGQDERELAGGQATRTTNNCMELMAAIKALESLDQPMTVRLHTDSTYVRNGIITWLAGWKAKGWLTAAGEQVKNVDLWQRLEAACDRHDVAWHWVKGHAGDPDNERADRLAAHGLYAACAEAGIPVPAPRVRERQPYTPPPADAPAGPPCRAATRAGKRCQIPARPSGLCHVHDPAVQCGRPTRKGAACAVATGGGPCAAHQDTPMPTHAASGSAARVSN